VCAMAPTLGKRHRNVAAPRQENNRGRDRGQPFLPKQTNKAPVPPPSPHQDAEIDAYIILEPAICRLSDKKMHSTVGAFIITPPLDARAMSVFRKAAPRVQAASAGEKGAVALSEIGA